MSSVFFVTRNYPPAAGGIETMAEALLAACLTRRGDDVFLLHFGQERCYELPAGLKKYYHFPSKGILSTYMMSGFLVPLLALFHRPGRVINMQVTTSLGSWAAGVILGIPYSVVGLGLELKPSRFGLFDAVRGKVLRSADKVISISRYTDSLLDYFHVDSGRRMVINPGTRTDIYRPVPVSRREAFGSPVSEGDFIAFSLCRLMPRKGLDTVITAVGDLIRAGKKISYYIAGTGPDRQRLEDIVLDCGLEAHVHFLGRLSLAQQVKCYSAADVFLMPSREIKDPPEVEGFGLVFLEAAACGTPSIGSLSGGIPDAIIDGKTGFLVEPENPEAVKEKLLQLMESPELKALMGKKAREDILEKRSWDTVSKAYLKAFFPAE